MHRHKIAAAVLMTGASLLSATPSDAQEGSEQPELELSADSLQQAHTIEVQGDVETCNESDSSPLVRVAITHEGETVYEGSTTTYTPTLWRDSYYVPLDAPLGTYTVTATCEPEGGPTVDFAPATFTVLELPRLTMAADPEVAAPGEQVTVSPVDACPNGGTQYDVLFAAAHYLGPDGTSDPVMGPLGLSTAIAEDGTWSLELTPSTSQGGHELGLYAVGAMCHKTYADGLPSNPTGHYETIYITVSEDADASPIDPPDTPPDLPDPNELPDLSDGSGDGPGGQETPAAVPVVGDPTLTG